MTEKLNEPASGAAPRSRPTTRRSPTSRASSASRSTRSRPRRATGPPLYGRPNLRTRGGPVGRAPALGETGVHHETPIPRHRPSPPQDSRSVPSASATSCSPSRWEPAGEAAWWMFLRCGECGMSREIAVTNAEADRFERALHARASILAGQARRSRKSGCRPRSTRSCGARSGPDRRGLLRLGGPSRTPAAGPPSPDAGRLRPQLPVAAASSRAQTAVAARARWRRR